MKFIEIVGNASTTGWLNGKRLGQNVSVAAYQDGDNIALKLESNGSAVRGVKPVVMTPERYENFKEKQDRHLMLRAMDLFDCETSWPKQDDDFE